MKAMNKGRKRIVMTEAQLGESFFGELLLEKWSRSEEIDSFLENVFDAVTDTIGESTKVALSGSLDIHIGRCTCDFLGENVDIEYYAYNANDEETIKHTISELDSLNGYDHGTGELIITLYLVNGIPFEPVTSKNIVHEAEHLLQDMLSKRNNKKYAGLNGGEYGYASEILSGNRPSNETERKIARIFYWSNPHEQDSFMNEYYEDLKYKRQFMSDKDSETHRILFTMKHLAKWAMANADDKTFNDAIGEYSKYGYNKGIFFKMIEKSMKRFEKKMKNVEKHYTNRVGELNESGMHYTWKDIGPLRRLLW